MGPNPTLLPKSVLLSEQASQVPPTVKNRSNTKPSTGFLQGSQLDEDDLNSAFPKVPDGPVPGIQMLSPGSGSSSLWVPRQGALLDSPKVCRETVSGSAGVFAVLWPSSPFTMALTQGRRDSLGRGPLSKVRCW